MTMNWITRSWDLVREKLNPAQVRIAQENGTRVSTDAPITYKQAFERVEVVNRGVSLIVGACTSLDYDVKDKVHDGVVEGTRQKSLITLLNHRPNPYQSAQDFRKNLFTDYILEGNAFIYYDGKFMYHLPAGQVEILTDEKTFIKGYLYNGLVEFKESEVFYIKDISGDSIYRGSSRLQSAQRSVKTLYSMEQFQDSFLKTVLCLVWCLPLRIPCRQLPKNVLFSTGNKNTIPKLAAAGR